jgi:XTP/dITP diphosphohydrolase
VTSRLLRLDLLVPVAIASRNVDKMRELRVLWGDEPPALVEAPEVYPEVAESFDSYEGNALLKARTLAELTGGPALADDSGIEVEAMAWGPGVRSARTPSAESSWEDRNTHILRAVDRGPGTRRARFVCVCALVVPGFEPVVARGEVEGLIAEAPRGSKGFGYDPIFVYPPYGKTFAEVPEDMKHAVSHRGRAVRKLRNRLQVPAR